jgi:hypothetical protein
VLRSTSRRCPWATSCTSGSTSTRPQSPTPPC